jgi:hypothetical protein
MFDGRKGNTGKRDAKEERNLAIKLQQKHYTEYILKERKRVKCQDPKENIENIKEAMLSIKTSVKVEDFRYSKEMMEYEYQMNLIKIIKIYKKISLEELQEYMNWYYSNWKKGEMMLSRDTILLKVLEYLDENRSDLLSCEQKINKLSENFSHLPKIQDQLIRYFLDSYAGCVRTFDLSDVKMVYRNSGIIVYTGTYAYGKVYKVKYKKKGQILQQVAKDMNVFISLNKCSRGIRFLGMDSERLPTTNKSSTSKPSISLYFDFFGQPLFEYAKIWKQSLRLEQILYILKKVAKNAKLLINSGFCFASLNPANIFLSDEGVWIMPMSYFALCVLKEFGIAKKKKFCDPEIEENRTLSKLRMKMKDKSKDPIEEEKNIQESLAYSIDKIGSYLAGTIEELTNEKFLFLSNLISKENLTLDDIYNSIKKFR